MLVLMLSRFLRSFFPFFFVFNFFLKTLVWLLVRVSGGQKLMLLKLLQKEYILINWATHQACLFVFNV